MFTSGRLNLARCFRLPISCRSMSQISQREAPALALARMARGTTTERHQHPGHQLIYVSTGVLVAQTPAGSWVASRDRAIWMPARTWHEHRAYGAAVIHTVGFDAGAPPLDPAAPAIVAVTGLVHELLLALTDPETARLWRCHARPDPCPGGADTARQEGLRPTPAHRPGSRSGSTPAGGRHAPGGHTSA